MPIKTIWVKYKDGGQQKTIGLQIGERTLQKNLDVEYAWIALGASAAGKLRKKTDRGGEPLTGQTKGKLVFAVKGIMLVCDGENRGQFFSLPKHFDKSAGTQGSGKGEFFLPGKGYGEEFFWSIETIAK